jgi:hypothetical protein
MFLEMIITSSEYCRALALQKASNDSIALHTTVEEELIDHPNTTALCRSHNSYKAILTIRVVLSIKRL